MAAVNIDSKVATLPLPGVRLLRGNVQPHDCVCALQLVKSKTRGEKAESGSGMSGLVDVSDVMELQNGCACCSGSDELLQVTFLTLGLVVHSSCTHEAGGMPPALLVETIRLCFWWRPCSVRGSSTRISHHTPQTFRTRRPLSHSRVQFSEATHLRCITAVVARAEVQQFLPKERDGGHWCKSGMLVRSMRCPPLRDSTRVLRTLPAYWTRGGTDSGRTGGTGSIRACSSCWRWRWSGTACTTASSLR